MRHHQLAGVTSLRHETERRFCLAQWKYPMRQRFQFPAIERLHQFMQHRSDQGWIVPRVHAPIDDEVLNAAVQSRDSFRLPDASFTDFQEPPILGDNLKTVDPRTDRRANSAPRLPRGLQ